jgi:hypothetical protein
VLKELNGSHIATEDEDKIITSSGRHSGGCYYLFTHKEYFIVTMKEVGTYDSMPHNDKVVDVLSTISQSYGELINIIMVKHTAAMHCLASEIKKKTYCTLLKEDDFSTVSMVPSLKPVLNFLTASSQPVDGLSCNNETNPSNELIVQSLRQCISPKLTWPLMENVADLLIPILSPTQYEKYTSFVPTGVTKSSHNTQRLARTKLDKIKQEDYVRSTQFPCMSFGSDNIGVSGSAGRKESTTHWRKLHTGDEKKTQSGGNDWVPMHKSGLFSPQHFLPSDIENDILRIIALSHYSSLDKLRVLPRDITDKAMVRKNSSIWQYGPTSDTFNTKKFKRISGTFVFIQT